MRKIDSLTSIRFLAAIIVVLYHLGGKETVVLKPVVSLAPYVISFFFVLSGFVMTLVYYRPGKPLNFVTFWVARISRIYPVYLLSLFLVCIHFVSILGRMKNADFLSAIFLLQAWIPEKALIFNFPAWTLTVELFFYLIFPFAILLAARQPLRRMMWISLGIWTINQLVRNALVHWEFDFSANFISYFPLFHLDSFLLGVVSGLWHQSENRLGKINPITNLAIMLGCVFIVLLQATLKIIPNQGTMNGLFSPIFAVIILMLSMDQSILSRVLSQRWLVALGESSYSFYALHVPVYWLLKDIAVSFGLFLPLGVQFIIYVPLLTALSLLVFRKVEWPAQNWLRAKPQRLIVIVLDFAVLAFAIWLSYVVRVGLVLDSFQESMQFATRIGVPVLFLLLILFGWYSLSNPLLNTKLVRSLIFPLLLGFFILARMMVYASSSGWIPSYPRSFPVIAFLFALAILFFSRPIIQRVKLLSQKNIFEEPKSAEAQNQ